MLDYSISVADQPSGSWDSWGGGEPLPNDDGTLFMADEYSPEESYRTVYKAKKKSK